MLPYSTILVTGGAGFIGSNLIRHLLTNPDFTGRVVNLDALTYAGNLANLADLVDQPALAGRYHFCHVDLRDATAVQEVFALWQPDAVIHCAAESHVDRSILGPRDFIDTNIIGTLNLLETIRAAEPMPRLHHVSTDEVYGSLGDSGRFSEASAYDPRSPYSASKAASDHLVRAWHHTWGLPVTISNCSNNYGPWHFPEKLIPLMILNMLAAKALPVYGDGGNVRDWLYVEDHATAIVAILERGQLGQTYMVGGSNEWENRHLVRKLCTVVAAALAERSWPLPSAAAWLQRPLAADLEALISFVPDRPGHDRRYAIDSTKIKTELGWQPGHDISSGLRATVDWYLDHPEWVEAVRSGAYRSWLSTQYGAS